MNNSTQHTTPPKSPITPSERIAAMAVIAIITIIIVTLDFNGSLGGVFSTILIAPIGIGATCAVLFCGRND